MQTLSFTRANMMGTWLVSILTIKLQKFDLRLSTNIGKVICLLAIITFIMLYISVSKERSTTPFFFKGGKHKVWKNNDMTGYILGRKNNELFRVGDTHHSFINGLRPRQFKYIINEENLCKTTTQLYLVLCIYTAPKNFLERKAIRETWGKIDSQQIYPSKRVFLLGAVVDQVVQMKIRKESNLHRDIIQTDFIDSYKNLSFKGISLLQWVDTYCNNTKYVVKADDDLYVDIFQIFDILQAIKMRKRFILGRLVTESVIIRKDKEKWKIHRWSVEKQFMPNASYYPHYFQGWCYISTADIIPELLHVAMKTPVFPIDDAYMTGILAGQIPNVEYIDFTANTKLGKYKPTGDRLAFDRCDSRCKVLTWQKQLHYMEGDDGKAIMKEISPGIN